ncbi:MAG: transposase [Candidatus Poribacteria bacterium]|nr:transposase [Candidatus Poribacteria bacterium]
MLAVFRIHLLDRKSDYILVGDEAIRPKSGERTYGLSRFFSALYGKAVPGLAFSAVSLVSVNQRCSYPMVMEQIVRGTASSNPGVLASEHRENTEASTTKTKRGHPKGAETETKTILC